MSSRGKKIFLVMTVVVPFLIYSIVYYAPIIRNAPFKSKEFVSLEYRWGVGEKLENRYDSKTGDYTYLRKDDSLVKTKIYLNERDIFYLDSIAHRQGFWNLPEVVANNAEDMKRKDLLRYEMVLHYQRKSKEVIYYANFNGKTRMKGAAVAMQKVIEQTLADIENRQAKQP